MLISYQELKEMGIVYSPKYIRLKVRRGQFPKPVKGSRSRKEGPFQWRYSDVLKWIESK